MLVVMQSPTQFQCIESLYVLFCNVMILNYKDFFFILVRLQNCLCLSSLYHSNWVN